VYEIEGVEEGDRKNKYHGLKKLFIADLDREGKEIIVARGGLGSKGNAKNIGIKVVTPGGAGEEREIYLELRCLADVGLVGYPNAGKSTFLASSSRALPRIAEYPFTTLNPMVGKVCFIDQQDFTIADIPGLIEDAHLDKGLGIEFLRHIERTKVFTLDK
jgi:GTP-binding protein